MIAEVYLDYADNEIYSIYEAIEDIEFIDVNLQCYYIIFISKYYPDNYMDRIYLGNEEEALENYNFLRKLIT